jgi:signal transduction histidine kinase
MDDLPESTRRLGRNVSGAALHDMTVDVMRREPRHSGADLLLRELAAANRRKDDLLATVSHELRNPLASIHNVVRLLGKPLGDPLMRERLLTLAQRQVCVMTRLVEGLIDVARIASGTLRLELKRIDLRTVVAQAIETLEPTLTTRNHRLIKEMPRAAVWLEADPFRLEQVFVNLLANASKYTDPGGELHVNLDTRDRHAVVRIRDSGIGIAPHVLPHVFDLFKQGNPADPHSRSGLGIGLSVVRDLIRLHGGSVTAASEGIKQGSEFTICLPRES